MILYFSNGVSKLQTYADERKCYFILNTVFNCVFGKHMESIDTTLMSKCLICEPFFMAVEYLTLTLRSGTIRQLGL